MTTTTTQQQDPAPPPPQSPDGGGGGGGDGRPRSLPGSGGEPVRVNYELQLKVQAQLTSMSEDEKKQLGHSATDLIVDCEFAGTTCGSSYVRCIRMTKFGVRTNRWRTIHRATFHRLLFTEKRFSGGMNFTGRLSIGNLIYCLYYSASSGKR